jgi:hypothetical protein
VNAARTYLPKKKWKRPPRPEAPAFEGPDGAPSVALEPLERVAKDMREAAATLTEAEARYLVDLYYTMQDHRIAADGQVRSLEKLAEPHRTVLWFAWQMAGLENQVATVLDAYSASKPLGVWARSITGVGPIIAAGLLAHIDLTKAPTVGHIWRFAGLDPTVKWEKKQKRPWNAKLKVLCAYKLGDSFVKVQNNENDIYGKIYAKRKEEEIARNEAGLNAEASKRALEEKTWRDDTTAKACYMAGKFPPARIHARARRYAVKLFLSSYHCVGYYLTYGKLPPLPYAIGILGHAHLFSPPNAEAVPGLQEALDHYTREAVPPVQGTPLAPD